MLNVNNVLRRLIYVLYRNFHARGAIEANNMIILIIIYFSDSGNSVYIIMV